MSSVQIHPSWAEVLGEEFSRPYFRQLTGRVREEYGSSVCYPPGHLIFNAFNECPWDEVRVVVLGQDPYINPGQAHGLAFSVPDGIARPPSLMNIFREIQRETGKPVPASGNLVGWARQGVLLLNTVLTVRAGESNSHQGLGWETFTDAVISLLASRKSELVFMLWGSPARRKRDLIPAGRHLILESAHPSPMSVMRGFSGNGHFIACNDYLKEKGKIPVKW